MGGIDLSNLKEYLEFEIVAVAGGSWMTPQKAIADRNFPEITKQVRKSIEIVKKAI
jgi:2-dehydro-3-deoxyphosphogluconate aldolase/(4S)-4-hydroxy-2-oxoglutarate aldolase